MKKNVLILSRILLVLYLICLGILCFGNFSGMPEMEKSSSLFRSWPGSLLDAVRLGPGRLWGLPCCCS